MARSIASCAKRTLMQARFPEHLLGRSDSSMREGGCTLPQPAFATMEEVRYAHELRMQLVARYLGRAEPAMVPWSVGAD
jgi:hypothetical protein